MNFADRLESSNLGIPKSSKSRSRAAGIVFPEMEITKQVVHAEKLTNFGLASESGCRSE